MSRRRPQAGASLKRLVYLAHVCPNAVQQSWQLLVPAVCFVQFEHLSPCIDKEEKIYHRKLSGLVSGHFASHGETAEHAWAGSVCLPPGSNLGQREVMNHASLGRACGYSVWSCWDVSCRRAI